MAATAAVIVVIFAPETARRSVETLEAATAVATTGQTTTQNIAQAR